MATHAATMEAAITAAKDTPCPEPLDAAAKTQLISDVETAVKAEFNSQGYTDAENSLVATINDPETNGPDPIVMWLDYEQPAGTPYRARCPLAPGFALIVGTDQVW